MYLEQESKFDSTKDASELGVMTVVGPNSTVKEFTSSIPNSIKVKG